MQWLASLLFFTALETTVLVCSIEKYWELTVESQDVEDNADVAPEITITNFLSCFEMTTKTEKKSQNDATTSAEKFSLGLRTNLSSETLAKLGR